MKSVLNLGGVVNSGAMAAKMARTGDRFDFIVFADTGGELPRVYAFLDALDTHLAKFELGPIVRVRKTRAGEPETLEERCLANAEMPSVVYGLKGCSQRFKAAPIEKWENNEPLLTPHKGRKRAADDRIIKILGFDVDELRRVNAKPKEDGRYVYRYPLVEWGWGRDECAEELARAGLPYPGKSSCFFCPNMEPHEIRALPEQYLARALEIERRALADPRNAMAGLGRDFSWSNLISQGDLFSTPPRVTEPPCECYDGAACEPGDEP